MLAQREAVYEAAKRANPERWSGATRDWSICESVYLNPEKTEKHKIEDKVEKVS